MFGVRAKLRAGTASAHARLEAGFPPPNARSSAADYHRYLAMLYGVVRPIERELAAVIGLDDPALAFEKRRKSPLLTADLLSIAPTAPIDLYAESKDVPALTSLPRALGCMYVLEGSTLGGRFILKSLNGRFANASRFLEAHGEDTPKMWHEFLSVLEHRGAGCAEEIVLGATDTFSAFERWLVPRSRAEARA